MNHTFVITFTEGEHKGETIPVCVALLLGRSREAGVRFAAPDISGKHMRLEDRDGELVLVQVGSGKTSLNGEPVAPGVVCPLKIGDSVIIAGGNAFSVEAAGQDDVDDLPTAALPTDNEALSATRAEVAPPLQQAVPVTGNSPYAASARAAPPEDDDGDDDGATQDGMTGTLDSESGTQVLNTLAYTPEVEEALARKLKAASRKRTSLAVAVAVLVMAVLGVGAWFSQNRHENPLTWPQGANGKPIYFNKLIDVGDPALADTFGFFSPNSSVLKVHEKPDAAIIETRIGKRQDVPARFILEHVQAKENLTKGREQGFADWRERKIAEGWRFEVLPGIRFSGRDSGVPYRVAKYTRTGGGQPWSGFVQYMRFRDWEFALLAEVLDAEWYRAESLLSGSAFYLMRPVFVASYWEPDGDTSRRPVKDLLDDAEKVLMPEETPGQMLGTVGKMLRDALTLALTQDDKEAAARGAKLLLELRARQSTEYHDRMREFQLAKGARVAKRARALRMAFLGVFDDEDDQRYHVLRTGRVLEVDVD